MVKIRGYIALRHDLSYSFSTILRCKYSHGSQVYRTRRLRPSVLLKAVHSVPSSSPITETPNPRPSPLLKVLPARPTYGKTRGDVKQDRDYACLVRTEANAVRAAGHQCTLAIHTMLRHARRRKGTDAAKPNQDSSSSLLSCHDRRECPADCKQVEERATHAQPYRHHERTY